MGTLCTNLIYKAKIQIAVLPVSSKPTHLANPAK